MISDSVPLMTAIDLLNPSSHRLWHVALPPDQFWKGFERPRISLLLIKLGLLAIALLYAADLATMHVLPMVSAMEEAIEAMTALHRNLNWLVILLAVISISFGFVELLVELQRRS
jgi:hypothetical protein